MFLSEYINTVDKKGRVALPAGFQHWLRGGAFIMQGFDRNLMILPTDVFERLYAQVIAMSITDPKVRLLMRMFLGTATAVAVDKTGQITLPGHLCDFAKIRERAVIIGQGSYFEVWACDFWNIHRTAMDNVEENAQRFASISLVCG